LTHGEAMLDDVRELVTALTDACASLPQGSAAGKS
jgi:hypothetical protein